VIKEFHLNTEQKRVFHIIANCDVISNFEMFNMYLGVGGIRKSQVIKALMSFFDKRKKSHKFIMVAPMRTATAFLNGSIYHSILGISDGEFISACTGTQIKVRLDGVKYIFSDEISMVSCCDLYKISAQATKAHGVLDEPFGRITFIFSGDFAQLPPVRICI
jgi:ATP-dependent DNA helicase PIF1